MSLVAGLQTGLPTSGTLCGTKEQDELATGAKAECAKEGVTKKVEQVKKKG